MKIKMTKSPRLTNEYVETLRAKWQRILYSNVGTLLRHKHQAEAEQRAQKTYTKQYTATLDGGIHISVLNIGDTWGVTLFDHEENIGGNFYSDDDRLVSGLDQGDVVFWNNEDIEEIVYLLPVN